MFVLLAACTDPDPTHPGTTTPTTDVVDAFDGDALDPAIWRIAERQWGGPDSGGVRPDLVTVRDGTLVLTAHGDRWTGGPVGLNHDGTDRSDGKRVGAAIATRAYLGSGHFEARMKVAPQLGVSSAIWTFFYQELYPGDPGFEGSNPYEVVNHEIDVEFPGRLGAYAEDIGFDQVLDTSWVGVNPGQYGTDFVQLGAAQDDGAFHTYAFDWHTGDVGQDPRVEWFVDGTRVSVNADVVPTNAGRLWLGAWFPNGWAGSPDFAETELVVDEVRYQPFEEAGDAWVDESYPDDGWAAGW